MRTITAAQRRDEDGNPSGVWDYVEEKNGRWRRRGYCAGEPPTTKADVDEGWSNGPAEQYEDGWDDPRARPMKRMLAKNRAMRDDHFIRYHPDGHESKEAAQECYAQYLWDRRTTVLDPEPTHATTIDEVRGKQQFVCEEEDCEEILLSPTVETDVYLGGEMYFCPDHQTTERIKGRLLQRAKGTSWQF